MRFLETAKKMVLLIYGLSSADAQALTGSILHVELVNSTLYRLGYCDKATEGKDPTKLPKSSITAFSRSLGIGDIVSVNGQAVTGVALETTCCFLTSTFTPGRAIADLSVGIADTTWVLTFLNLDGTTIGNVYIIGNSGPTPGPPNELGTIGWVVTGGTGPFFGARGYWNAPQDSVSGERQTTDCEDPAYRRINADPGGNKRHGVLYLVPATQPQILVTPNGPAVIHGDGSPVTAAKPANAGEILSLFASGLGPTRPGVDPGQPFSASPLQVVNSPVQVLMNGNPSEVLYAGGYPGAVDGYQVNFRIPNGVTAGQSSLQLSSAWIVGPAINLPVQ